MTVGDGTSFATPQAQNLAQRGNLDRFMKCSVRNRFPLRGYQLKNSQETLRGPQLSSVRNVGNDFAHHLNLTWCAVPQILLPSSRTSRARVPIVHHNPTAPLTNHMLPTYQRYPEESRRWPHGP